MVDRIINDLRKTSCAGMMHIYGYTSELMKLEYVVSQKDFPMLFSNNYTRVGNTLGGVMALLLNEWNLNIGRERLKKSLTYWMLYGDMYETFVSKIIIRANETQERVGQKGWQELKNRLISTSIQNGIRTQEEWDRFFQDDEIIQNEQLCEETIAEIHPTKQMPIELQSEEAQIYLSRAIELELCDRDYHWLKSKTLLAYYAEIVSDKLGLSKAEQNNVKKVSWKPFESLFGVSGLSSDRNMYRNKTGVLPKGSEIVDSIFK
ncbi:MAG: DUF6043 family protein [Prevotellaceae bacterium]|nr:DUF6043 family protein [Prevotellaceae bacterium]